MGWGRAGGVDASFVAVAAVVDVDAAAPLPPPKRFLKRLPPAPLSCTAGEVVITASMSSLWLAKSVVDEWREEGAARARAAALAAATSRSVEREEASFVGASASSAAKAAAFPF